MTRDDVISILAAHRGELDRFGVTSIAVFGSIARGEVCPDSDIDLLVEFEQTPDLFEFIRLKTTIEGLLGRPVDLVTADALHQRMREQVLREAVRAA